MCDCRDHFRNVYYNWRAPRSDISTHHYILLSIVQIIQNAIYASYTKYLSISSRFILCISPTEQKSIQIRKHFFGLFHSMMVSHFFAHTMCNSTARQMLPTNCIKTQSKLCLTTMCMCTYYADDFIPNADATTKTHSSR